MPISVSVHVGKRQNKTPPLSSLGPLEREIRDAPKLRMWQRTEAELLKTQLCDRCSVISGPRRCTEPGPAGCLKVTPTLPCWETSPVCLFAGSLYRGLWVSRSHCCPAVPLTHHLTPAREPLLGGATFKLNFLCVLSSFLCVFLKIYFNGPTLPKEMQL